jgi:Ca2+-binding RTX toxin-like protein
MSSNPARKAGSIAQEHLWPDDDGQAFFAFSDERPGLAQAHFAPHAGGAIYRLEQTGMPPSDVPWAFATQWSVVSNSKHAIKLLNVDGTFTVLQGDGFALNGAGEPISGAVHSLERLAPDGSTVLEHIGGENLPLSAVRTALDSFGFIDTFLSGNDIVLGTDNSAFFGNPGSAEVFFTGAGNDIVFGRGGTNAYIDGPGSDLYIGGTASFNTDVIYDVVDYSGSEHAIRVFMAGKVGSFASHVTFKGSSDVDTLINIDQVYGTTGNDVFTVDHSYVNKQGDGRIWIGPGPGPGHDIIHGNGQTVLDVSQATDGVYVNFGLGVAHSLHGAPQDNAANIDVSFDGVRAIHGSAFDDVLIGSNGPRSEEFMPGRGNDYVDGGGGLHDQYNSFAPPFGEVIDISRPIGFAHAADPAFDHFGRDTLVNIEDIAATEFDDDITGSAGDNILIGRNGNDVIRGGAGNDTLIGDQGDGLFGTAPGNDVLIGGLGRDVLTGNGGHDTFRFESIAETGTTAGSRDVITDFTQGGDLIDLAAIDANSVMSGNQGFTWRGDHAFAGTAGELHVVRDNQPGHGNDRTIVEGDVNGDRVADFRIELSGLHNLTQHDFLL